MKRFLFTAVLLFFAVVLFAQRYLPSSHGELVEHKYIKLSYMEKHEQAEWVYCELTPEFVNGNLARTDDFRPDPKVSTASAQLSDYSGSGYDRGHLCPAGSMTISTTAMSESFYLSNMSPQVPAFNRGGWKQLEGKVRDWVADRGKLYLVTGPIFNGATNQIGGNKVTVPNFYYKVVYAPGIGQMIAFVMPNAKIDHPLESYAVNVDEVERLTGIDFFPELDDRLENPLEEKFDLAFWNFYNAAPKTNVAATVKKEAEPKDRCQGITASGQRCKRLAKAGSSYCFQHERL